MLKVKRGLALILKEKRQEIARLGGKAAHEMGIAHTYTHEEAIIAGRKGGKAPKKKRPAQQIAS
jgi:general stress protein YciG